MKKLLYVFATVLAFAAFTACDDGEGDVIAYGNQDLKVLSAELIMSPDGGSNTIVVETSGTVTATTDAQWLSLVVNGKNIVATAGPYSGNETRYAKVDIKSGSETTSVTLQQFGVVVKGFNPEDLMVVGGGDTFTFPFESNASMTVFADVDWITATVESEEETGTYIKIVVSANTTVDVRTGNVNYSAGAYNGVIKVTQASSMIRTSNWTVTYEGVTKVAGVSSDDILVTVGAEDTGKYAFVLEPKSAQTASGLGIVDYIATEIIAKAAQGSLYTTTEHFYQAPKLANDTYVAYVVGIKDGGVASGFYQYLEFTINRESTPYEKFLGNWSAPRGDGNTDIWTIYPGVEDESVYIDGIGGSSASDFWGDTNAMAYATFTSYEGYNYLTIKAGQIIFTFEHSSYGTCNVTLQGTILEGSDTYRVSGDYNICDILLTSDTSAKGYSYDIELTGGGKYTVKGMRYYGIVSAGGLSWASIYEHIVAADYTKATTQSSVAVNKAIRSEIPFEVNTVPALVAVKTVKSNR